MRKHFTLFSLFMVLAVVAAAQSRCGAPISNVAFQQAYRVVQSQKQPQARLTEAKTAATSNCLSAEQVKQIASLFDNDYDRLEFCKTAYPNTFDKDNFYEVYDVFAYYSTVFRLHDFVNGIVRKSRQNPSDNRPPPPPAPEDPYKNITFPDYRMYTGNKGCNMPIAETDFAVYLKTIQGAANDNDKMNNGMNLSGSQCLSAAQLMKISLTMELETSRLNFLKQAFGRCYDQGNYLKMIQVFKHQPNQDALIDFYNEQAKPQEDPGPPPCSVSEMEMISIKATLSKQNVESSKVSTIKQILRSKKCFSVNQVKTILKMVNIESYKMELAKFAYEFTINKEDYYQVADVLQIESYKRELTEFLESKQ